MNHDANARTEATLRQVYETLDALHTVRNMVSHTLTTGTTSKTTGRSGTRTTGSSVAANAALVLLRSQVVLHIYP